MKREEKFEPVVGSREYVEQIFAGEGSVGKPKRRWDRNRRELARSDGAVDLVEVYGERS